MEGYHWYYGQGVSVGAIPTNAGQTCVFVGVPHARFQDELRAGPAAGHQRLLNPCEPDFGAVIAKADPRRAAEAEGAHAAVKAWSALRADQIAAARRTLEEIDASSGGWTFAKLTIANAALRELALTGEPPPRRRR